MFFLLPRAIVVLVIVFGFALAKRLYHQWQVKVRSDNRAHPSIPRHLLGDADRNWVVFTTPYCATCGPVKERLRLEDPTAHVASVDVTMEPALADAFRIRSAPTVIQTDRHGNVTARLVGAQAVAGHLAAATA